MVNLKEIQEFIRAIAKSGVSEVELETEGLKLVIKVKSKDKNTNIVESSIIQQTPIQQSFTQMPQFPVGGHVSAGVTTTTPIEYIEKEKEENIKFLTIKSPMVGTFYRRPSPDKQPFVNIGDEITSGKVVCIIEAMKLFNEIEAEVTGKIAKILVEDGKPVEFDQPLFLVEP